MTIEEAVVDALQVLLVDSAKHDLTGEASPIETLGLESVDGIEFAVLLEDRLACSLPENANPFVDDERGGARTISGIVAWIAALGVVRTA